MVMKYSSLKEKDLEYLEFVLKNGVVTAKQIQLKFLEPNIDRVYRRMRKLADRGYVKHERLAHKVGVYIGTYEARSLIGINVTVPTKPSLYTIQHELLLTDLALYYGYYFKQKGTEFSYISEREIRYEAIGDGANSQKLRRYNEDRERIPDAIYHITVNGSTQKIWIELELNKKEQKRYDEKFKEVFEPALTGGDFASVWYFTDALKIKNAVNRAKSNVLSGEKIKIFDIPPVILNENWEEVLPNDGVRDEGSE